MEEVLTAFRTFRDSVSEEEFFRICEINPELDALISSLMDLDHEETEG